MAVAIANSAAIVATSNSYTASAGSNRLLLFILCYEDATGAINPSFGGTALTDVGADPIVDGVQNTQVYAGYLLDADIPSGAQSLSLTTTGMSWVNNAWGGAAYTLTGVNQSTPISPAAVGDSQAFATTWTTSSVTSVTDGFLFSGGSVSTAWTDGTIFTSTGWTQDQRDANENGGGWLVGSKAITSGTSESCTYTWASGSESGGTAIFGVNPAAGGAVYNAFPAILANYRNMGYL